MFSDVITVPEALVTEAFIVTLPSSPSAGDIVAVSDYANIGASKTITLKKNDGSTVVFTSATGSPSTNEFQVQTNNDTTATNLKNTINGHADFSATVSLAEVTVTRATVGIRKH